MEKIIGRYWTAVFLLTLLTAFSLIGWKCATPDFPPVVIDPPPIVLGTTTTTATTTTTTTTLQGGCTCDLSKPVIKEHREQGHRNDNEGSRNFRTCTDADRGGWFFVDPFATSWLKGCIETDGRVLRARCNPATGAHYKGWRNSGDADRDDSPIRKPVPEFQIKPIAHVYFEHRKVAGSVEPPIVERPTTGNVPTFAKEADIPAPRKPPLANQTAPKNIKGRMPARNADQCTQIRFGLQGYFRGEGYDVGYPTESNPRHGAICVSWRKEDPTYVEWEVMP